MVTEQLEKLKTEREERARVGATTPPSPAVETDLADTRHILQPVDRGENPDSPSDSRYVIYFRGVVPGGGMATK